MIQHIRERSRKPSKPQVRDGAGGPGISSPYAKTQDCSLFSTPTLMRYYSLETSLR